MPAANDGLYRFQHTHVRGCRGHPNQEPSRRFLRRVRHGRVDACSSTEVLQEILYRYSSLDRFDLAREVYDLVVEILPGCSACDVGGYRPRSRLGMWCHGLSARDALHAAVMLNHDVEWIATFDSGFDGVIGIRRMKLA